MVDATLDPNAAGVLNRVLFSHQDLGWYRDSEGRPQQVKTIAHWRQKRLDILMSMQEVIGPLPGPEKRCPLDRGLGRKP